MIPNAEEPSVALMKIKVRNFTSADINEVRLLIGAQDALVLYPPYTYWLIARYFNETSFVIEYDGKIAGYIASLPVSENILFIWHFIVSVKYRGLIRGDDLLSKIMDIALANDYKYIQATARVDNVDIFNCTSKAAKRRGLELQKIGSDSVYDFASNETINFDIYQCDLRPQ
jgi:ribosomal protein S18 acetylase RimI-like enzyme